MRYKWSRIVHKWLATCLQLPSCCMLCSEPILQGQKLCVACHAGLPWLSASCMHCALPCRGQHNRCVRCQQKPPIYDRLQGLFDYRAPLDRWIMQLKYQAALGYAVLLSDLMLKHLCLPTPKPDCIIPMPLHPKRQRQRGFNQTLEIAKRLGKYFQIPVDAKSCKKNRHTLPQSQISAPLRRYNIQSHFFTISPSLKGQKVLIIEDVVTTGSTLEALSIALKNVGVSRIDVWTCCRTLKKNGKK